MNPKLSLLIGIVCISFSPIFIKLLPVSALTAAFYRIFFAWLFLAPYCLAKGKWRINPADLLVAAVGGLVFAADIAVWNISILKTTATISTLVANLAPVWVGLLSLALFKKQPGISFWVGTFVAVLGMIILVGVQNMLGLQLNQGIIYALVSSVLYAIYILITKNVLQRINTLVFMFYNMLAASVALGAFCLADHDRLTGFTANTWLVLVAFGLLCQLAGWLTINYSIHYLDSTQVSLTLLSQAVVTALLAWLILNETMGLNEIAGGVMVLTGIAFTFVKRKATA